ncbi:MAG TPA: hypothetical protein VHC22_18875 [Pirellulales bacterium]|nr:hypothetical protein [Pirellulales bacterium]
MHGRMLKYTSWLAVFGAALIVTQIGCVRLITTLGYFVQGTNDDPEFEGLKDKKVAIVCRPLIELKFTSGTVTNDIAERVGQLLRQNGKRIKVVKQSKVNNWTDENPEPELREIGQGVDADIVLGIDLEQFSLYQGQTLYQGKSQVKLTVCNVADGEILFDKPMRQIIWPTRGGQPSGEKPVQQFQREYVEILATEIGNHFYPHDHFARNSELDPE